MKKLQTSLIALALALSSTAALSPQSKAWFVFPSGIYANVWGKQFYLGDFASRPDPQCPSQCSWAVRYGGNLAAHGNGRTPAWVVSLVQSWLRR